MLELSTLLEMPLFNFLSAKNDKTHMFELISVHKIQLTVCIGIQIYDKPTYDFRVHGSIHILLRTSRRQSSLQHSVGLYRC